MKFEIYRFDHYINVVDGQMALRQWIIDNVPYQKGVGEIPESVTFEESLEIAKNCGYQIMTKK